MLNINSTATRKALAFPSVIATLRAAFRGGYTVPARHVHHIKAEGRQGTSLIMPAWSEAGYYGVKVINIFAENTRDGLPGLHASYALYCARTGVPLAQIDGNVVTAFRTAAAAALGADYLARRDAQRLLVLGSGRIAGLVPAAMRAVRPIEEVMVWNVRQQGAQALARRLCDEGFRAWAVTDLQTAVSRADIVSCATLSTTPLVRGEWLRGGTHLDLIGSFTPEMMEADPACFAGTSVYVDTDEAPTKSGDLLEAFKAGTLRMPDIRGTLFDLVRGQVSGRSEDGQITVFKAVGSALEDLALAALVYEAYAAEPELVMSQARTAET
ncbi:ornithine cyclodeaminase family protein [Bordetella holmesii]|uniref:Ornithine cyclodeaminase n=2 Tax=Bordetella holmesii TaxID=35814 RepID=A0A158M421_9BORD|nr:ornithine cyclodeaminase family protein [Bordetella holmesii]AHV91038.1 shikimate / quinate 5-dehydrogenase family protein [Bordetella holmesii ATCC 51541]AIT27865.1 shikimate / quinate 5-dehydrogenase family protein [Bordetella holmesii 44057]EWM40644.1 shikimate / quinate 5-dehydrogenase family protein [Bordetella holmesii 35009]EWM44045.1 shikimate / quinate 5-dehydrogenase family protein [Bordetella holmesii 41130]EWM44540.1 shikimate / quinate 5-dehydrogenase family protein [Bordetella